MLRMVPTSTQSDLIDASVTVYARKTLRFGNIVVLASRLVSRVLSSPIGWGRYFHNGFCGRSFFLGYNDAAFDSAAPLLEGSPAGQHPLSRTQANGDLNIPTVGSYCQHKAGRIFLDEVCTHGPPSKTPVAN